jgi:2-dehydro-3-deoxygluconokinase
MTFKLDLITFGESMGLIMPDDGRGIETTHRLIRTFGGAESNVAIGVSRLGHKVGWFGSLGDDPFGHHILKKIRGEGVDTSRVDFSDQHPTGFMMREKVKGQVSVYYYRKGSAASHITPNILDEDYIAQSKFLHVTGITAAISPTARDTLKTSMLMAKKHNVKICFDPNIRLKLWTIEEARSVILELAELADYFLPGLQELQWIYRTQNFSEALKQLSHIQATTVVKGGNNCSYLVENGQVEVIPYVKAKHIVDTVGAGDAYCAGFISGLIQELPLLDCVKLASLLGSMNIQVEGDWEGLPTNFEVSRELNKSEHIER